MEYNQHKILLMTPQYCCYDIYNLFNTFMKTKVKNLTISLALHEIHPEGPKWPQGPFHKGFMNS